MQASKFDMQLFKGNIMKKLIIALDGQHFPKGAFEFAKNINLNPNVTLIIIGEGY